MATTYSATILQDAIYKASKKDTFQSFETRGSVYGALDAAVLQTPLILPKQTLQNIKQSMNQTTKVDVFKREAVGTATNPVCAGTGAGSTASVTVSYSGIFEVFGMSKGEMLANRYGYAEMFQLRLEEKLKSIYTRLDTLIAAQLDANYSEGNGTAYNQFMFAKQIPNSDYDLANNKAALWLNKVKQEMFENDFNPDNIHLVGNAPFSQIVSSVGNQGAGNDTNLSFQFQGVGFSYTNRILNNLGRKATAYAFEKGAFGLIDWTDPMFRAGEDTGRDVWTTFVEPRYGLTLQLKVRKDCSDNSAILSHMTADYAEGFSLGLYVATPFAYSSDANTGVYKYEFDTNDNLQSGSGSYI